ncbi:MAG: beta-N-acetylhexosaminidase, partial [Spirosomaceae bacterium]|nr:beta-N-acetylhexosaminidase [Spirosomataceae bacterium]
MKRTLLLLCLFPILSFAQSIIPAPVSYESTQDMFMLDNSVSIDVRTENAEVKRMAEQFAEISARSGTTLKFKSVAMPSQQNKAIIFSLNTISNTKLGDEGYTLSVKNESVEITANKPAGIFNGIQTLRQLLPADYERKDMAMGIGMLMGCEITDYPRFGWRGLMLDVSRHFFTVEEVKEYIDMMSRYKFNTLHWHLTDDNGWRIEIKSLPKLTEVGAWRVERFGHYGERKDPQPDEPATYGGFYTHEDIKEVVAYAAALNVTIVPEIDVPGHSLAMLAAYPELSIDGGERYVNPGTEFSEWYADGTFKMLIDNTLDPSNEKVYEVLDKVFTEVAALFPNPYIHIGGDECYHGYWEADSDNQKLMKKEGLKNGHELQGYFLKKVGKIVRSKGKKVIGWDEILEGGLSPDDAVMSWRGMKGGIEAAKMGHPVVMTPTTFAYLDYTQGDHTVEQPIYADLSLKKAYSFEPVPEGVDQKYILGGQGNLWTEQIPTIRHAFYMTYPRAFAISETLWSSKEKKDWGSFVSRTEQHFQRFDAQESAISRAIYDPIIKSKNEDGKLVVTITSDLPNTELYYTIDNTFPDN